MTPEERAKYLETYEVSIMGFFYFYLKWYKNYLHEQVLSLGLDPAKHLKSLIFHISLWSGSCYKENPALVV